MWGKANAALSAEAPYISRMKFSKSLLPDKSDSGHEEHARTVKQFEAKYGEDWEDTMIEYDNDFVNLPEHVVKATVEGDFRTVLQWLGKGNIKERVNAKCEDVGNMSLLSSAALGKDFVFASVWVGWLADWLFCELRLELIESALCSTQFS